MSYRWLEMDVCIRQKALANHTAAYYITIDSKTVVVNNGCVQLKGLSVFDRQQKTSTSCIRVSSVISCFLRRHKSSETR
jgi:hypothetical protein